MTNDPFVAERISDETAYRAGLTEMDIARRAFVKAEERHQRNENLRNWFIALLFLGLLVSFVLWGVERIIEVWK